MIHIDKTQVATQVAVYILLPNVFALLHWLAVRIYSNYCSPSGFTGLITSLFNTANPFCSYTLEILNQTKNFYTQSWILIGVASVGLLNVIFNSASGSGSGSAAAPAATAVAGVPAK